MGDRVLVTPRKKIILALAPIRGITDAVYRQAFARCFSGLDYAVAPFIQLRQGHSLRAGERLQMALENNLELRMIPQVLTNNPESFSAGLRELHGLGHNEVNWNLGCPHPTVAGRGRGAGLLPHPERIDSILDQVLNGSPVRLSVKMRLGYRNPDEFLPVIEVLNCYPLTEVILHPRTAEQMYDGAVDLERVAIARSLCKHPFVFNGDVNAPGKFCELRKWLPGVDRWMIGRGVLACPFLPAVLKGGQFPAAEKRRYQLREFHDLLLEGYCRRLSGQGHLFDKMKEHWEYLSLSFAESGVILSRIRCSRNMEDYTKAVDRVFGKPLTS
jgi:tRNA-dihydrouridine synthase